LESLVQPRLLRRLMTVIGTAIGVTDVATATNAFALQFEIWGLGIAGALSYALPDRMIVNGLDPSDTPANGQRPGT
jgi:hypothetical protein